MNATPCPDENLLAKFLEGNADPALKASIEAHIDRCAECTELLSVLAHTYRETRAPRERGHSVAGRSASEPGSRGQSEPPSQRVALLVILSAVHITTLVWLVPMMFRAWTDSPHPRTVTVAAYLASLLLVASLAALSFVVLAGVLHWWGRGVGPLLVVCALSWPNPAALVLASYGVLTAWRSSAAIEASGVLRWLVATSIPVYTALLTALLAVQLIPAVAGAEPRWAVPVLGVLVLALSTAVATLAAERRPHWSSSSLGAMFGVASVLSGVGTGVGLAVIMLFVARARRAWFGVPTRLPRGEGWDSTGG